jgi:hypothetical protein
MALVVRFFFCQCGPLQPLNGSITQRTLATACWGELFAQSKYDTSGNITTTNN